jgi:hypothetical protein
MSLGDEEQSEQGVAAQNFFQLSIYDPAGAHIVSLRLKRQPGMTIGDMAQLQNFFWVALGRAVRINEEMRRHLTYAGFEVLDNDPNTPPVPISAN